MNRALFFLLTAGPVIAILAIYRPRREGLRANSPARENPAAVRSTTMPRLPAPHLSANPTPPEPVAQSTNRMAHLLSGEELPKLSREQLNRFLEANGRRAGSLLAAFRVTGDKAWLKEALE